MGNPYTSQSISGYNSSPPPDDGTTTSANQLSWSKHKTKLSDPVKTLAEGINTAVSSAFGKIFGANVTSTGGSYTVLASDQGKLVRVTGAATITTPAAATVGAPFVFGVRNEHSVSITLDGNGSETVDGAASVSIPAEMTGIFTTDGTNWYSFCYFGNGNFSSVGVDAGATSGPIYDLYRNSASPADNDYIGEIRFSGNDDGANKTTYSAIVSRITDASDGTEDAEIHFQNIRGGSAASSKIIIGSGLYTASATGGDQGANTINASGLYIDGVAVSAGSNLVQVLDADPTENEVVNTVTETDLYSFSVPANTLGTDKTVRLSLRGDYLNDSGAGRTLQIKVKFGATTLYDDTTAAITANAVRRAWALDLMMSAVDSASAQVVNGTFTMSSVGPATTGTGQIDQNNAADGTIQGTSAEDSTGALTFAVTVTHATASASLSIRRKQAVLELLP